jgi:hypothetical protein
MLTAALALAFFLAVDASSSSCQCASVTDSQLHNQRRRLKEVVFQPPNEYDAVGEKHVRSNIGSPNHKKKQKLLDAESGNQFCDAEQIHFTLGGNGYGSVIFSFVSANISLDTGSNVYVSVDEELLKRNFDQLDQLLAGDAGNDDNDDYYASLLKLARGKREAYSEQIYIYSYLYSPPMGDPQKSAKDIIAMENTANFAFDPATGDHWAYWRNVTKPYTGYGDYNNPHMYYDSPYIHTAAFNGLESGTVYYYRVSGSCSIYQFIIPEASKYPMKVALTGDMGQTEVSEMSFSAIESMDPDFVMLVGDLSYADGFPELWDSYGNMVEPYASHIPTLTTGGNHEFGFGENAVSYQYRWPTPYDGSGSSYPCYWGREVGSVHVLALCSYAGFTESSLQYAWLKNYLSTRINRERTPWIIAMMHAPFYNSNRGHWMEGELMRRELEPLLYEFGVDVVLSGHVHSYERTYPVFNNTVDECGITYFNLGDGGNYEGAYADWWYLPDTGAAPTWTAFREGSFGVGELVVLDEDTANYSWHRHACQDSDPTNYNMNFSSHCSTPGDNSIQNMITTDSVIITRPAAMTCPNRHKSTTSDVPEPEPDATDDAADSAPNSNSDSNILLGLMICTGFLLCLCFFVFIEIARTNSKIAVVMEAKGFKPSASPTSTLVREVLTG